MAGSGETERRSADKTDRRAARELIAGYHRTQLRILLEHVRAGFVQFDAGEIDEFDADDVIHHYKRSAAELWKFCGSSGGQWQRGANALKYMREQGEEPDWWERGRSSAHQVTLTVIGRPEIERPRVPIEGSALAMVMP